MEPLQEGNLKISGTGLVKTGAQLNADCERRNAGYARLVPGDRHHGCAHASDWAEVVRWKADLLLRLQQVS